MTPPVFCYWARRAAELAARPFGWRNAAVKWMWGAVGARSESVWSLECLGVLFHCPIHTHIYTYIHPHTPPPTSICRAGVPTAKPVWRGAYGNGCRHFLTTRTACFKKWEHHGVDASVECVKYRHLKWNWPPSPTHHLASQWVFPNQWVTVKSSVQVCKQNEFKIDFLIISAEVTEGPETKNNTFLPVCHSAAQHLI